MKHVEFWLFQVMVLVGVAALSLSLFSSISASTAATPNEQRGKVLADSASVFYQLDSSRLSVYELYRQINHQRSDMGVSVVVPNSELSKEARRRAIEMQRDGFYAHAHPETGLVFSDSLRSRSVIEYRYACENLNLSFSTQAHLTIRDWLNSDAGHRQCMLHSDVSHIGIATIDFPLSDGQIGYIVVMIQADILGE